MKSTIACIGVPGRNTPLTPMRLQLRHVDVRNDTANQHEHIIQPLLAQERHQLRRDVIVRAGQDGEADDVGVLLQCGRDDLLRGLAQAGVDDLHAGVTQRAGDDLRAAVVPVEARLGNHDS